MNEIERVARDHALKHFGYCDEADLAYLGTYKDREAVDKLAATITAAIAAMRGEPVRKYALGDRLTKTKGSAWTGRVVGFYSTSLTPVGYAIESENEPGSVQIYPESALQPASGKD